MKLSKTEARIMEELANRGHFCAILGKARRFSEPEGIREWKACENLIDRGLAVQIHRGGHTEYKRGVGTRYSELVIKPKE